MAGVLAAFAAAFAVACGAHRTEPSRPATREAVRIATSGDYPPFSLWLEGEDVPRGFEPDLLRTWAAATGRRIEWTRFSWPGLAQGVTGGAFDLAAGGITIRSDRSLVGTFGVPLAESGAVVLVPVDAGLDLDSLDAPGRRIGVNHGGHLERVARVRFPLAESVPTTPNSAVPKLLDAGAVDAVVTDDREAPLWLRGRPDWIVLGPFTRDRKAVLAAPGREALLSELDGWLLERPGRDALDALRSTHLGDDPRTHSLNVTDALLAAMDERLSLMPAVARFKRHAGLPIEVPEREQRVVDAGWQSVVAAAARSGRAPPPRAEVEAFYRAQIEAAKEIQRRVVAADAGARGSGGASDAEDHGPDLDTQLRPALIRIGDRMAELVVRLPGASDRDIERAVDAALPRHELAPGTLTEIARATRALALDDAGP